MRLIKFALLVPCILLAQVRAQTLEPATPESQGMDSAALARLVEYGANVKMDSVVVVRNGRVVAEAYYAPFRKEMVHRINSATKAVVGTLAGIAIARGDLPGTDATVQELFPEAGAAADGRWNTVKLQHLLDMTAGVEWNEPLEDTNLFPTLREMERSGDWVKFVLDRKVVHTPGLIFNYNSGLPHLVAAAISRRAAMSAEAYAAMHLFEPLGIHNYRWRKDPQGTAIGGWGLYLHTRDMARFGVLYLQGGQWNGKQVIPRAWVERVFSPKVDMEFPGHRYADFWWSIPRQNAYFAAGFHRQLIMVLPQLGVVAAVTGRSHYPINDLIAHLERATRSATPMPDDAAAQAQLQAKIAAVATAQAAPAGRSVQAVLKGGAWQLDDNRVGIRELTLDFTPPRPTYKVKLRSREFAGEIGLNGRFGLGEDAGTPVFTRASWKDPTTLEMEQHWPEEAGQMFYTLRFDGDAVELTHTNQFGVRGTVRGRPLRP
jgi:CubicO group peptidase (beta-lactamase class C family)